MADASHYVELIASAARRVVPLSSPARDHAWATIASTRSTAGWQRAQTFQFLRRLDNALQDVDGDARGGGLAASSRPRTTGRTGTDRRDHRRSDLRGHRHRHTTDPGRRIATLDPPLAGSRSATPVHYTPVRRAGPAAWSAAGDVQTLVHLSDVVDAGRTIRFDDGDPPSLHPRRATDLARGRAVVASGTGLDHGADLGDRRRSSVPRPSARGRFGRSSAATTTRSCRGSSSTATGGAASSRGSSTGPRSWPPAGRCRSGYPPRSRPTEIGGREDLWIRARLVGGDYGRPKYVVTTTNAERPPTSVQSTTIDTSDLHPPEITSIEASFVLDAATAPESVLVVDNLATLDQTQASAADQARFALFSGARAIDPDVDGRALYVGLTRQPVSPLVLYAVVDDQDVPGTLAVDVLTAAGWRHATVDDETGALHRTGLVQVFLSTPLARAARFGREGFWLRLRPATGATGVDPGAWQPVVRGLFVNGVPAKQARTIVQEILGSSLGEPSLALELAETPVLPETLELRVREQLSEDEREALEEERRRSILGSGRPPSEAPPVVGTVAGGRRHLGALASRRLLHRHGRRRARVPARSRDRARHLRQRPAGEGPAGGQRRDPRLPLPAGRWPAGQRAGVERPGGEVGARGHRGGGAAGGRGRRRRQP